MTTEEQLSRELAALPPQIRAQIEIRHESGMLAAYVDGCHWYGSLSDPDWEVTRAGRVTEFVAGLVDCVVSGDPDDDSRADTVTA